MTTNHKTNKTNTKPERKHDERERITAKTLAAVLLSRWAADIQAGKNPFGRPCYTLEPLAVSHDTGRRYSLSNQALLDAEKPTEYCTFIQAKKEGGHVIKGAKASYINYFRELKKQTETDEAQPDDEPETDEAQPARRMLFAQGVFALDQTEGTRPRWEYPQTMSHAAARARVDALRAKYQQVFERVPNVESALFVICKTWDAANTEKPEEEGAAAAFELEAVTAAALAAALIVKATGEPPTNPAPVNEMAEALNEKPMRIYGIIARAEKAARAILKMEEEPQPVKLPQPEQTEAEPEQEQPEPEQTTEPAKTPVYIATKNKYCEPFTGETLPFKKIPAGALVKLTKTGLTRHDVEIFTGGLFYRAKVKNLLFLEESPAQVWPSLKPEPEPEPTPAAVPQVLTYEKPQPVTTCAPLRAVLIDDDDDDESQYCICTLAGAGF